MTVYMDATVGTPDDWSRYPISAADIDQRYPLTQLLTELLGTGCRVVVKASKNVVMPNIIATVLKTSG